MVARSDWALDNTRAYRNSPLAAAPGAASAALVREQDPEQQAWVELDLNLVSLGTAVLALVPGVILKKQTHKTSFGNHFKGIEQLHG
jgi:hypothetical protein